MSQPEMTDFERLEDEEEEIFDNDVGEENTEDSKFDEMIGVLQDILIDPDFVGMQSEFCRNNCEIFDNVSENKLIYMDIFQQYTDLMETFIERRLHEKLESFSMADLCNQIQEHEGKEAMVCLWSFWLVADILRRDPTGCYRCPTKQLGF